MEVGVRILKASIFEARDLTDKTLASTSISTVCADNLLHNPSYTSTPQSPLARRLLSRHLSSHLMMTSLLLQLYDS